MKVTVGTFNLNNLFSRYNFDGEIDAIKDEDTEVDSELKYEFGEDSVYKIRSYKGKLVKGKDEIGTVQVAKRILDMDLDVLAVQEVEDIDTLREFNRNRLNGLYPHCILIEGNDPRLIDLGILSKLPLGPITSWQQAVHPDVPGAKIFGRDLLQVEVLDSTGERLLFTLFNNHLKSNYVPWNEDQEAGKIKNRKRRTKQSEVIADIVQRSMRSDSLFLIVGDMNDTPESDCLQPFVADGELPLINGLEDPEETRPAKHDDPPPPSKAWTHRFKKGGPAQYELYDQIWLSPKLVERQVGAWIDRRTKHSGDGSDHDPAWVVLEF